MSETAGGEGLTKRFAGLLTRVGVQKRLMNLDNTPRITVFMPWDQAFEGVEGDIEEAAAQKIVDGHVVVAKEGEKVGYLPNLLDGQVLTTEGEGKLEVSVRGKEWYIGEGRIVKANLVLTNGVAHVINKVCLPTLSHGTGNNVCRLWLFHLNRTMLVTKEMELSWR